MDQNVFSQPELASFMNSNFINWKLQFDKTDFDTEEIKALYAEANRFKSVYSLNVYPTYLIFDNTGVLVHRIIGGSEATSFLEKCKEALNPEMQYESLIANLLKDRSNIASNKKVLELAQKNLDLIGSNAVLESLENSVGIDVILTPEFIPYIVNSARSSTSYSFNLIKNHMDRFDEYLLPQKITANEVLSSVLIYEYVLPLMRDESKQAIDFEILQSEIEEKHSYVDLTLMMSRAKIQFYGSKKDWLNYCKAVNDYISLMGMNINPEDLSNYAQLILRSSAEKKIMDEARQWLDKATTVIVRP